MINKLPILKFEFHQVFYLFYEILQKS